MSITSEIIRQHNLTDEEYQKILEILGREPNLVELGIFSVMWSEHCSYKSSRKFLKGFPTEGPQVVQGPGENAGVVDIGDGLCAVFKMESHNHPSFIEPYQGAATGVGGILRDVFTMGARPIANLNALRFGEPNHPKTPFLVNGVVAGIAGYGNCMGIPTVGGEVFFDACYNGNNLVNAMTVGLVKRDKIFLGNASGVGNPILYVGSKTGRDGIHGATMASDSFDDTSEQKRPTVQVGDPFTEKRLLEACLELMATDAIIGIQDMGAAGLTSSSFEMASRAETGLLLDLDQVPLREEGMTPYEILLSESQERMLLVCKQGKEPLVREIFEKWDLDAQVIGKVTDTGMYIARFHGEEVVRVPVAPLAHAAPIYDRPRKRPADLDALNQLPAIPEPKNYQEAFLKILNHPNQASKKWVYRQYDHQVMTNTAILPGSDAAVVRVKGTKKGLGMTTNCNSRYCYLNPRLGSMIAVAESGRNLVCSGAKPLALTDCLNFGNPERPEIMWQFVESVGGISEACRAFEIPVISGNVSLYNETNSTSIYPTPMIGMVGLMEDIAVKKDQFFKKAGDLILLLGDTFEEVGASEYLAIVHGLTRGQTPNLDISREKALWATLTELIHADTDLIQSAHDLSDGGLAIAAAESCMGKVVLGAHLKYDSKGRDDLFLFSESQSRALISADPKNQAKIEAIAKRHGVTCTLIGQVTADRFILENASGQKRVDLETNELHAQWSTGFEKNVFKK